MNSRLPIGLIAARFSVLWKERAVAIAEIEDASKTVYNLKMLIAIMLIVALGFWSYQENLKWLTVVVLVVGYFLISPWYDAFTHMRYQQKVFERIDERLWNLTNQWNFVGGLDSHLAALKSIIDTPQGFDDDKYVDWAEAVRKDLGIA